MLLNFSERIVLHIFILSGNTSAKATMETFGPDSKNWEAAPVPLSPHPTRAAFSGLPSGAISTKENMPSSSGLYFLPDSFFSPVEQDVIKVGVAIPNGRDTPRMAELDRKLRRFIVFCNLFCNYFCLIFCR